MKCIQSQDPNLLFFSTNFNQLNSTITRRVVVEPANNPARGRDRDRYDDRYGSRRGGGGGRGGGFSDK